MTNTTLKKRLTDNGITLIEILVAVAIVGSVLAGLTLFAPRAVKAIAKVHTRSVAASLATSKVEEIKAHPYAIIPVTPTGPYFSVSSSTGPCDCSNVDFTQAIPGVTAQTSSETITVGHIAYTRQTCVNYIRNTPLLGWHSNCTNDTGLKEIVTNVSWILGNETQLYTLISLASPPSQTGKMPVATTGNVSVTVCPADKVLPVPATGPNCATSNLNSVNGAEVAFYNGANNVLVTENGHNLTTPNPVLLSVPTGSPYTLHVQKAGYFPYHLTNININATSNNFTVVLRDFATYGSKLAGEVFVADHPVISKVVAHVADYQGACTPPSGPSCQDSTEAIELYNPTKNSFTFGPTGNIQLVYCNNTACTPQSFTARTLAAASYLLIEGLDTVHGVPNPEWGVAPDITYPVTAGTEGLIPYKTGGGVQLRVNNGSGWQTVDAVHWVGQDGSPPANPPAAPAPWKGSALPQGKLMPMLCK